MHWSGGVLRRFGTTHLTRLMRRLAIVTALSLAILSVPWEIFPSAAATRSAAAVSGRTAHTQSSRATGTPRYLVLMVLDGGRPDYFGLTHLPHVDKLRRNGIQYTRAIDGILESETPAGHATIATGSPPKRDGILGFDWAQGDNDYSLFSPTVVRAGAIEHIMESNKVPTIAGLYKARYPHATVVALSGHKYYAADPLGGPRADVIMYYTGDPHGHYVPTAIPGHVPPQSVLNAPGLVGKTTHLAPGKDDHFATLLALSAIRRLHPRILLINYPEFDWPLGHVFGGIRDRRRVSWLMTVFDRDLGSIEQAYARAHILKRTLFVITADHGMAPIQRFIPDTIITNAVTAAGTTAPAISYSTGTYIWLRNFTRASTVADTIARTGAAAGVQSAYYLSNAGGHMHYVRSTATPLSPALDAANHALLTTLIDGHQPTVVTFAREGATFSPPSNHWKGDHGGAAWQSQHIPLIFSGPGIKRGVVTSRPAKLEDVAPTLLWDMGVNPAGMTGHVLSEALVHPPTAARVKARVTESRRLTPLVNAMVAQEQR